MLILKYLQLPLHFDVSRLQEDVRLLAHEHWQMHYQTKHYEGEWSALPLRSTGGRSDNIIISPTDEVPYGDTVFLEKVPYLGSVLQSFPCPLLAVRLLKLNAGAFIRQHRDAELNYENGEIRLHIPVTTHEDVEFYLDDERMHLREGECWYMNFNLPHRIHNKSTIDRVHLVIDAKVNDWVKETFARPDVPIKKEIEDQGHIPDDETKRRMIRQFREMNTPVSNMMADELEEGLTRST